MRYVSVMALLFASTVMRADPLPPPTPTDLTVTVNQSSIILNFDGSLGATGYDIFRSTVSGEESLYARTSVPSFLDSTLTPGIYFYEVAAVNAYGTSSLSPEADGEIVATATPEPASLLLLGTGLIGGIGVMRRTFLK